jgi:hypothetical protein
LWFIFWLPFCVFLSCASLSPVDSGPEKPVMAASPETVVPQWRPFAENLSSGLSYFAGATKTPRLEFRALRIDLADPGIQIVVRAGAAGPGSGTRSTRVSSFVRDNKLLAGINATPFDPVSAREGETRTNVGIVVSGGVTLSAPNPRYHALVLYQNGGAAIVPQAELRALPGGAAAGGDGEIILDAAGGFHLILQGGSLTERALNSKPRYARSAAGLGAEDSKFLYLLVIDGSRPGMAGAAEGETALLLRALGAKDGLNLDGGGSSALALRFPDGAVRTVNIPAHGGIPGRERAVAACLGVGVRD